MASFTIGPVNCTGSLPNAYMGKVDLEQTVNAASNSSTVAWAFKIWATGTSSYIYTQGNQVTIVINGVTVINTANIGTVSLAGTSAQNPLVLKSGTTEVPHNTDGSKTLAVSATYRQNNASYLQTIPVNGSVELQAIPRVDTISSCPDFTLMYDIGATNPAGGTTNHTTTWTNSSNFYHKIEYKYGNTTLYTSNALGTNVTQHTYAFKASDASYVTDAKKMKVTVALHSYSDSACTNELGVYSKDITVTFDESFGPLTYASITLGDLLNNAAVAGYSSSAITCGGTFRAGASLKESYAVYLDGSKVLGGAVYGTTNISLGKIPAFDDVSKSLKIQYVITDTRGFSVTNTANLGTVYGWAPPSVSNVTAYRCTSNGTKSETGGYYKVTFTYSIRPLGNANSKTAAVSYKYVSSSLWSQSSSGNVNNYSDTLTLGPYTLNPAQDEKLEIRVSISDTLSANNASTGTVMILPAAVFIDIKTNGESKVGLGIGTISSTNKKVQLGWDLQMKDENSTVRAELDPEDGLTFYGANGSEIGNYPPDGSIIDLDTTLAVSGAAADSKAVGDALTTIRAQVGAPLVANTSSAMTDSTRVYVYTGNQTGYVNGNWYYWNGYSWTSGGVYNSVAVQTDTTLKLAGVAADAKTTGVILGAISESLGQDNIAISGWTQGTINQNTGATTDSTVRIRSNGFFSFDDYVAVVVYPSDFSFQVFEFDSDSAQQQSHYVGTVTGGYITGIYTFFPVVGHYYRVVISYQNGATITPSDAAVSQFKITGVLSIGESISSVHDELSATIEDKLVWIQGGINANNGNTVETNTRVRSSGYQNYQDGKDVFVNCPSGYKIGVREYNANEPPAEDHFIKSIPQDNSGFSKHSIRFTPMSGYYYRYVVAKDDDSEILVNQIPADFFVGEIVRTGDMTKVNAIREMFKTNVGNCGILCAKEHNHIDGFAPTYEYYILGDPATNRVYYSKDLTSKIELFTFGDRLGYWSFGIDANNNIICCKQAEYLSDTLEHSDSLRINPIVYLSSEFYRIPHEVNFGSALKPCGWLSSVGFICLNNGDCLLAEYTRPVVATANVWKISGDPTIASNWSVRKSFTLSGSDTGFKHVHCVMQDFYTGVCYFGTGDDDSSSHTYYSTDNGNTWTAGKTNSEKYCRFLNLIFTKDWVYWSTDSNKVNYHFVFKAPRRTNGVIDFNNITDLIEIPLEAHLATYGCAYFPEYGALLLLERVDNVNETEMPVRVYDIATNTLHTVYTLESIVPQGAHLGFRTRFAEWYPKHGEVNLAWHLRGSSLGSVGYNQNKMFSNQGAPDTINNINNACLRLAKNGNNYSMVIDTRYI